MKKLALLSACALLTTACSSPANNAGTNRSSSLTSSADVNASSSTLNENAYTSASNSELGNFKLSVGKTASEIKLWQNKEIDSRLKKLMGDDYASMKMSWNTETPIKKFGDFLMMTGCQQNNCTDNRYVIFMDMGEGNIKVVHIGKDAARDWKENGDIVLPPPFAVELAAMKSKK